MSKKIYRIENIETGNGPYNLPDTTDFFDVFINSDCILQEMADKHDTIKPVPLHDFDIRINEDYFFACRNMTSLKRWFGKYFDYLLNETYEFAVFEYVVKEFIEGKSKKQVAFINDEENVISRRVLA